MSNSQYLSVIISLAIENVFELFTVFILGGKQQRNFKIQLIYCWFTDTILLKAKRLLQS